MSKIIMLDTGCLVAVLYRRDEFHKWAVTKISKMAAPLLTCEAVIAEACFLTQRMLGSSKPVYDFVESGALKIDFNLSDEFEAVKNLAERYQNVPMSLADACLVRMSEIHENSTVFTTDSDFLIYRQKSNQAIPVILP
ncbi:MAG: PIN domain-containing protein [Pyrinomonadaceae bacterium]